MDARLVLSQLLVGSIPTSPAQIRIYYRLLAQLGRAVPFEGIDPGSTPGRPAKNDSVAP